MVSIKDNQTNMETPRLIHRPFTTEDIPRLVELRVNPDINKFIGGDEINTPEWIAKRLQWYLDTYEEFGFGMYAMIWKETGELIGWSGLQKFGDSGDIDVGYGMSEEFWGRGIALETAEFWVKYTFTKTDLKKLVAVADVSNTASNKVLAKVGLIRVGETNHFGMHCYYYEMTKDDYKAFIS
ncbi:MAG: GNAT family N-acetyltransferase [Pyrinomonadaceae bacterium]